jgi:hypothetical protein
LRELKRQHFKYTEVWQHYCLLLGDYSQLAPIGTSIYNEPNVTIINQTPNCFLNLQWNASLGMIWNGGTAYEDLEWGTNLEDIEQLTKSAVYPTQTLLMSKLKSMKTQTVMY